MTFDLELVEEYGCQVFAFDPTPKSVEWVRQQNLPPEISFNPWGVADFDGSALLYPPLNKTHMSHSLTKHKGTSNEGVTVDFKSIGTTMELLGHNSISLLKMDIEGGEYAVINDIIRNEISVNQLCVEFHHRFSNFDIEDTRKAVSELSSIGLYPFTQERETCSFLYCDDCE